MSTKHRLYLKQAWNLMKQNRLFTSIYIAATGLSIALVMTLFIIFYVKFAPIYPEYNRNSILTISTSMRVDKNNEGNWSCNSGVSYYFVSEYLQKLKHAEAVATVETNNGTTLASKVGDKKAVKTFLRYVNADFWQVFTFQFLAGRGFSPEEQEAVQPVVVLSESFARRIFAHSTPLGEKVFFNGKEFTVIGVVKDPSNATPYATADAWTPITHNASSFINKEHMGFMGGIHAFMLASDKKELRREVLDMIDRYNQQDSVYRHEFFGQPDDYWMSTFRTGNNDEYGFSFWSLMKNYIFILIALIFIPALNLSGMISNRMDSRMSELGVRRAYGASSREIIRQVLWENLLLTATGSLLGLALSYLIILTTSDWILHLFDGVVTGSGSEINVTFEMLFNPIVFGSALLFCVLLNLISALIPTVWALKHSIINSIHSKR